MSEQVLSLERDRHLCRNCHAARGNAFRRAGALDDEPRPAFPLPAARARFVGLDPTGTGSYKAGLPEFSEISGPMARQFIYHMQGLSKTYPGGKKVLENIHLSFYPDAKIGVLGVNGAGKSTLLKIMAGMDEEYSGEAWVAEGARVGYLPQEPQLDASLDVRGNVMLGVAEKKSILDRYNELAMNYSDETADEMTALQDEIEAQGLWDLDSQVDQAMDALGCPPDEADVGTLSGGERRRVALCKLLLEKPELLLLDEPTNHLDAETVNWLEGHLRQYPGAILIVTHDRYFLDNVTGWILELDRGRGIPYEGNYSSWLGQKQKRLLQEGREEEARQRALMRGLLTALLLQPLLLLHQPGRIIALIGNAAAAIELEDPLGDVVEEVAIVRHCDDGAFVVLEEALQPGN